MAGTKVLVSLLLLTWILTGVTHCASDSTSGSTIHVHLLPPSTTSSGSDYLECSDYHKDSTNVTGRYGNTCNYIMAVDDCSIDEGFINYLETVYCSFGSLVWLGIILMVFWWLFLFIGLAVTADDFFCPSLTVITKTLRLSHNIAGVTLLAFGNGAPDIFSAIAAIGNAKNGDAGLAVGALFGAGIFVTTVVVGAITIIQPFHAMERPFLRDIIFYIAAVFWTFYVLHDEQISTGEAIGFIALYAFYVLVVVVGRYIRQRQLAREKEIQSEGVAPADDIPRVVNSNGFVAQAPEQEGIQAGLREAHRTVTPRPGKVIKDLARIAENLTVSPVMGNEVNTVPALQPQISQVNLTHSAALENEMSPLLGSREVPLNGLWSEFVGAINPVDTDGWNSMKIYLKVYEIFKAPILFVLLCTVPVVDYDKDKHNWNKILNTLHCVTAPLIAAVATKGIFDDDYSLKMIGGEFPVLALILLIGIALAVIVCFTSKNEFQPVYHWVFAYMGFVVSVIWIYSIANEVVNILQMFGVVFNLSNAVLGLTLLAWGNSIGDLIADTVMARQGFPKMGISACFGGPLFNLLLGIGIPFTLGCIKKGGIYKIQFTGIQVILALFLILSLVSSLILSVFLKFHLNRQYGVYLILLYVVFLLFALLTESGVLNIDVNPI